MLPKIVRLHLRSRPLLFAEGKRLHGRFFSLVYNSLNAGVNSKGAIVVSKMVAAKSTVRNTLKRQIRRLLSPLLLQTPGYEVVVLTKHSATKATESELRSDLSYLFTKLPHVTSSH